VVPGIYDLLKLSNGWKKLLPLTLEISKVQQIRLILEQRNVVLDGTTYPLSTQVSSQA
jgi:hypothetical protein